jgi:hypothetical protein
VNREFLSLADRDLAEIGVARGLLSATVMRKLGFALFGSLAACGSGHQASSPDAMQATHDATPLPHCTSSPTQLISRTELAPPELGTVGVQNPSVAVDATGIYFNLSYTGTNGAVSPAGHLVHVAFSGERAVLADAMHPTNFVLAGDDVIYIEDQAVRAVPRVGGMARTITPLTNGGLWVAPTVDRVFFGDGAGVEVVALSAGNPTHVSSTIPFSANLIGSDLVIADFNNNQVSRISTTTLATQPIATAQVGPLYPLACGDAICWINAGDAHSAGSVLRAVPGDSPQVIATSASLHHPHAFTFDGADFFATVDAAGGELTRVRSADGSVQVLSIMHGDGGVAVDDHCVYYSNFDGIFSLAKDTPAVQ